MPLEVNPLRFTLQPFVDEVQKITLKNTADKRAGFKLLCTHPKAFPVKHRIGVIAARSTQVVTVTMRNDKCNAGTVRFMVKFRALKDSEVCDDKGSAIEELFKKISPKSVTLKCKVRAPPHPLSLTDRLNELDELLESGRLTEAEYARAREVVLFSPQYPAPPPAVAGVVVDAGDQGIRLPVTMDSDAIHLEFDEEDDMEATVGGQGATATYAHSAVSVASTRAGVDDPKPPSARKSRRVKFDDYVEEHPAMRRNRKRRAEEGEGENRDSCGCCVIS